MVSVMEIGAVAEGTVIRRTKVMASHRPRRIHNLDNVGLRLVERKAIADAAYGIAGMVLTEETLTPELASLLASIHEGEILPEHWTFFANELMELNRLGLIHFDAHGALKLTQRGYQAAFNSLPTTPL